MEPDREQRTQARSSGPTGWNKPERIYPTPDGVLRLETRDFNLAVKVTADASGRLRPWLVEVTSSHPTGPAVTPRVLATAPLTMAEAAANVPKVAAVLRMGVEAWVDSDPQPIPSIGGLRRTVVVPAKRPYHPVFWESVADAYHEAVVIEGARDPAVRIAKEAGAPVPTVRAWIARCRDQGLIATGSQGRVG